MRKPIRKVRRIVRRALNGQGKGRGKGAGIGRNRRHTSGKGKGRRGSPKDGNGQTMECDICHITQHFRRECPRGDGGGRGPSMHLAQTDSDI
eukprot:6038566-Pyramimonas_sp.AAC.1